MSDTVTLEQGGIEIETSLAELAQMDMTGIEAAFGGFVTTPANVSLWAVKSMAFEQLGDFVVVAIENVCTKCYAVQSDEYNTDTFVGYEHTENIFIKDVIKDKALIVGFLSMIGVATTGKLDVLFDQAVGINYVAKTTNSVSKKDKDKVFANMDIKNIMTQEAFEATMV